MVNGVMDTEVWGPLAPSAAVVGGFGAGLGVLIGGISLLLIWLQTRTSARVSNQIAAIEAQKDYIDACLEHPELSSSMSMAKSLKLRTFKGILDIVTPDTERALWFISYSLHVMEQVIIAYTRWEAIDPCWRQRVDDQLGYHAELLEEIWPAWSGHYSDELNEAVARVLARSFTGSEIDIGRPFQSGALTMHESLTRSPAARRRRRNAPPNRP